MIVLACNLQAQNAIGDLGRCRYHFGCLRHGAWSEPAVRSGNPGTTMSFDRTYKDSLVTSKETIAHFRHSLELS
jgi:hypothetical protein